MQVRIAVAMLLRVAAAAAAEGQSQEVRGRGRIGHVISFSVWRNRCEVLRLKKEKELIFQRNSRHDRVRLAFQIVFDNPSGYFIPV